MNERLAGDAKHREREPLQIHGHFRPSLHLAYVLRSFKLKKQNGQINLPDNATSNEDEKVRSRD